MKGYTSDYYSKIKDIFLELPGFSYYHSPSGRFTDNPKMVGREKIKKKLYGILTNSETKSGSYIITGFRGIGKTSLINSVINQLRPRTSLFLHAWVILITWGAVHYVKGNFLGDLLLFFLVFFTVTLTITTKYDKVIDYCKQFIRAKLPFISLLSILIKGLLKFLIINYNNIQKSNSDKIIHILAYVTFLEIIFNEWFSINFFSLAIVYILLISSCWFFNRIFRLIELLEAKIKSKTHTNNRKALREVLVDFLKKPTQLLEKRINHSQKIFVRISFPQDITNSEDILKSLVHNIYKEYQNYRNFNRLFSRILILSILFFIVLKIYNSPLFGANHLKSKIGLAEFFPSQTKYTQGSIDHFRFSLKTSNPIETYKQLSSPEINDSSKLSPIQEVSFILDFYILAIYNKLYNSLNLSNSKFSTDILIPLFNYFGFDIHLIITVIPKRPDFIFWGLYLFIALLTSSLSRYSQLLGLRSNHYIKSLLKELNDKCLAEIAYQSEAQLTGKLKRIGALFNYKRSKKYPIAGAREIENDLIFIFDELDRVPKLFSPPEFIFVFDELDKVDPQKTKNKEEQPFDTSLESEKVRNKRELVASIMASMKIFFTTAKAKFIFIAGREMYDASLADNADRESFLGSIFHDVIYVSSLYKDPFEDHSNDSKEPIDITYWTEKYVCQLLLPPSRLYEPSLKGYADYLKAEFFQDTSRDEDSIEKRQFKKVINTVSVFINYLAFRSKGSPMNLFKLFEDFAEEFPNGNIRNENRLVLGKSDKSFYLTFDYQAQYRISFVAGIFRPYVIENGLYLKYLSDKILISTSYLLDHIYRFHEFGFSWRNLELLPEIIDINRAPLLRRHIEQIIIFLSDSNLKKVNNGFVNFKFHRKIIEEIRFLSRRSDTESATFNFILDESYALKSHYDKRLQKLVKEYNSYEKDADTLGIANSIYFLQSILGDLHFFDKEYDEAIIQYANSVQILRNSNFEKWDLHQTFLYLRSTLREALVFERINTYEPAFAMYSKIVEIIRQHGKRLKEIGEYDEKWRQSNKDNELEIDESSKAFFKNMGASHKRKDFHFAKSLYENFSLMILPILAKLAVVDKISQQGITLKDSLRVDRDFHATLTYLKKDEKFILKADYHLQKGDILFYKNGLLYKDYGDYSKEGDARKAIKDYGLEGDIHDDLNVPLSAYQEYMIGLTYLVIKFAGKIKLGKEEITLDDNSLDNPRTGSYKIEQDKIENYKNFTEKVRGFILSKSKKLELLLLAKVSQFLNNYGKKIENENIHLLNINNKVWHVKARLFSAIGDCLLVMDSKPNLYEVDTLVEYFILKDKDGIDEKKKILFDSIFKLPTKDNDELGGNLNNLGGFVSRTTIGIAYFFLSSICYRRSGEIRSLAYQYKKILFVLKSYAKYIDSKNQKIIISLCKELLLPKIIEQFNKNRDVIVFQERSKLQHIAEELVGKKPEVSTSNFADYYRFSYNTEIKLSILNYLEIYILDFETIYDNHFKNYNPNQAIDGSDISSNLKSLLEEFPIDAYNTSTSNMLRLFELRLKSRINRKTFVHLIDSKSLSSSNDDDLKYLNWDLKQHSFDINSNDYFYLIADGIFCELKIIEGINLNEITYIKGFFHLAFSYMSLGWWGEAWSIYLEKNGEQEKKKMYDIIGEHQYHYIDNPEYAYQKALDNFYKCINMHSDGAVYRDILSNMYFTEGDFSDDNQHFCAAYERFLINNQLVRKRIDFLKSKIKDVTIFK